MTEIVSLTRFVAAPPEEIFDLLARPSRHAEIDGSGWVRGEQPNGPERLSPGAKFGMQMKAGLPYKILNEVVEFDEGRLIAWRHFGGHVWRYRLEPAEGGTLVTEQFDPTGSRSPLVLKLINAARRNRRAIEETLTRLQAWAAQR